jgi:hypothetical protein
LQSRTTAAFPLSRTLTICAETFDKSLKNATNYNETIGQIRGCVNFIIHDRTVANRQAVDEVAMMSDSVQKMLPSHDHENAIAKPAHEAMLDIFERSTDRRTIMDGSLTFHIPKANNPEEKYEPLTETIPALSIDAVRRIIVTLDTIKANLVTLSEEK